MRRRILAIVLAVLSATLVLAGGAGAQMPPGGLPPNGELPNRDFPWMPPDNWDGNDTPPNNWNAPWGWGSPPWRQPYGMPGMPYGWNNPYYGSPWGAPAWPYGWNSPCQDPYGWNYYGWNGPYFGGQGNRDEQRTPPRDENNGQGWPPPGNWGGQDFWGTPPGGSGNQFDWGMPPGWMPPYGNDGGGGQGPWGNPQNPPMWQMPGQQSG